MAGARIVATRRTKYDFSNVPASGSYSVFIAKGIPVWRYNMNGLEMVTRIHSLSIVGSGAAPSLQFVPMLDAPSPDDPSLEFYNITSLGTQTYNLDPTITAPLVDCIPIGVGPSTYPQGAFVRVQLTGTQSATKATTFWVVVSVDIVAKS